MRFLIIFLLVLGGENVLHGQLTSNDLDDLMLSRLRDAQEKIGVLKSEYYHYVVGNHCDSLHVALFFGAHLKMLDPEWAEPPLTIDSVCPVRNHALFFALGQLDFHQGNMDGFEHNMRLALRTANTPFKQYMAEQSMGVVYQLQGKLDSAYQAFARAFEVGQEFFDPIGMNNLANAALIIEQWEEAVKWTVLAEERFYEEVRMGKMETRYGSNFHDEILSNRLFAEMNLLDHEAAAATFERMRFVPDYDANAVMSVATAVAYLIWANRKNDLFSLRFQFEECLALDSALAVETMGAHVLCFEPWKSHWLEASGMKEADLWSFIQKVPIVYRDAALPASTDVVKPSDGVFQEMLLPFLTFALWGSAVGFAGLQWRQRRKWKKMDVAGLVQIIETAFAKSSTPQASLALHHLAARFEAPSVELGQQMDNVLTNRESDVLRDWVQGKRPKDTAQELGISAATVYNMRVTIRKKLAVPEGEDLAKWCTEQGFTAKKTMI